MKKPNLFIVGAAKSGTTAMNDFLNQHPDIFMAQKELHFFGSDLNINQPKLTEQQYLDFFKEGQQKKIIGESSVWYLFSREAVKEIKAFSPDSKIIIMLRNPVEMMQALHKQNIYDANEDIINFEEAVAAVTDRKNGKRLPKNLEHLSCLLYTDVAKYYEQVKRYFDAFGKENVHTIIYDDFKNDNLKTYRSVLNFLEVDPAFEPTFEIINQNKEIKNLSIHQFIKHPPDKLRQITRVVIPHKPLRHFLMDKISKWNVKTFERHPLDEQLKKKQQKEIAEDVMRLSELLQRDLTFWLK
jgi:hypothetical protein